MLTLDWIGKSAVLKHHKDVLFRLLETDLKRSSENDSRNKNLDSDKRGDSTISKENFNNLVVDNRIGWGKRGGNIPRRKRFLSEVKQGIVPQTFSFHNDVGHAQEAKKELIELVDFSRPNEVFITPKPTRLIQRILQITSTGASCSSRHLTHSIPDTNP